MQALPPKRWEGNCTESYLRGLNNQNYKHLINICESSVTET